jgi:hypothetical protein
MRARLPGFSSRLAFLVIAWAAVPTYPQNAPTPTPEIKRTVDAFVGRWVLTGTDMEPGAKTPAAVHATVDCRSAALGAAVNCLIVADVSETHVEAATVIGYSPEERVVRWMEISSSGEYHDHRGRWNGNEIQFDPLTYTNAGAQLTEHLTVVFPAAGGMAWQVTTDTSEGPSRLLLKGSRQH